MADLTQLQAPAAEVIRVAAAKAGLTPAVSSVRQQTDNLENNYTYLNFCIERHRFHLQPYHPRRRVSLVSSQ
jgi:hypothetical protein